MKRFFSPDIYNLIIKRSLIGRGLFAGENIRKNSCIIEYVGKSIPKDKIKSAKGKYLFWTGPNSMIDGNIVENKARFINHSCIPNCEVEIKSRRIYIFALRTIKAGEELTYNYGSEYFDTHIKPYGCKCEKCLE